jgi:ethanolamine transporter EutH
MEVSTGNSMTIIEKIGNHILGFMLCLVTAAVTAAGLHALVAILWIPLPNLLFDFGSRFMIASVALASTVICLLWWVKNEDMKRGVWCFMYFLTAVAIISLAISLLQ